MSPSAGAGVDWRLLRAVSRSFYLTLRLLPAAVREPIALAYLLARLTDTEADGAVTDAERELLARREEFVAALEAAPDRDLIVAVWQTIQEGQEFDRQRFPADAPPLTPEELDRYTYLVAGCVGDFWTKICARRLPGFARDPEAVMAERGIAYGQGLQLVNILRDRAADRKLGRIYVPDDRLSTTLTLARLRLESAADYVQAIRSRRLRAATVLPLLLARETLDLVAAHPEADRVKVPRRRVWVLLWRALTSQ